MCIPCFFKPRCPTYPDKLSNDCTLDDSYWRECPQWDIVDKEIIMDSVSPDTINLANVTFINDLWIVVPASEIILKVSIFLPIIIWGIFGNILLLYVIIKNRNLRSPTNLLISNMAAADLITLIINPCVFLIYDFFQNYQLGRFGCKVEGALECAVLLASVMNLVAISYDRLNAIVLPQERRLTIFGAKVIMVVAWIVGIIFATPLCIYRSYKERQWLDFLEKYCTEDAAVTNIYWHVIITMMVWFPLGIMLVCYIALFLKLNQYEQVVLRRMKSFNVNYKRKVAKMMFIVVITFMVCRLPFTALIFYRNQLLKKDRISSTPQVQNQVNGTYHTLWFVSRYLIVVNAAINPVIYGLTSEKFRRAFMTTTVGKWLFVYEASSQTTDTKTKKKQKQNTAATTSNKIKIFSIFKGKLQMNRNNQNVETVITDSGSNVQIIK